MTNKDFTKLVEQYERFVFTICYQFTKDCEEAQNLSQETFLSAYYHIDNCDPKSYKPYLARIAANKAKDYLKSAYQRHVLIGQDEMLGEISSNQTPDTLYLEKETISEIREKIYALREPYQKVSILYFLQEKSVDEISKQLKRPPKTVQTQLYRAKLFLKKQLKEEYRQ